MASSDWHRRRNRRIGGSEVAAAIIASGKAKKWEIEEAPKYLLDSACSTRVLIGGKTVSLPFFVARKLGLREPQRKTATMDRGLRRERELLFRWAEENEAFVWLANELPAHARHAIDHECDALAVTFDGLLRDEIEGWVPLEAKCPRRVIDTLPWHWRVQVQAQIAVALSRFAVIVIGPGWGACDDGGGDPISFDVRRDDAEIERVRSAARWAISILRETASLIEEASNGRSANDQAG